MNQRAHKTLNPVLQPELPQLAWHLQDQVQDLQDHLLGRLRVREGELVRQRETQVMMRVLAGEPGHPTLEHLLIQVDTSSLPSGLWHFMSSWPSSSSSKSPERAAFKATNAFLRLNGSQLALTSHQASPLLGRVLERSGLQSTAGTAAGRRRANNRLADLAPQALIFIFVASTGAAEAPRIIY